jgi:DNA (cytosine-5)-methyltransferase 1
VSAYYNENDPYCAQWLRNLIAEGLIAPGDVDERDIQDVSSDDLKGYTQHHFFAGIGGWSFALRRAGWPDERAIWTGSCPCQPFSEAGQRKGFDDDRHLWPAWFRLIAAYRPPIVAGEQVPEAIRIGWLDAVAADLEAVGYSIGAAVLSACVVEARQERERLWFVACTDSFQVERPSESRMERHSWAAEPAVDRVAHGIPSRVEQVRAYGNAIVPQLAAEVISAFLDLRSDHHDDLVG